MKIRSILTIKYAGITATIFLVFMATIYCVNEHLRSDSFYRSLRSEAITKAHLFLNNQVDVETMQSIYLNNRQFVDEVEELYTLPISGYSTTMRCTTISLRRLPE